jgi:small subunit ribosomal protein S16
MAVHIRLQRHGSHKRPFYHVVATDQRSARDGKFLEKLGYYDPKASPSLVEFKSDRLQYWFERGAQLSNTVHRLVQVKKIELSRKVAAK